MSNNITLDAGSGGSTVATDEIGGVHYPYNKLAFGADNTATIVSTSDPLPVTLLTDNAGPFQTEDGAHSSGDVGIFTLAVRNDTLAALAGTDGDYAPFQVNASGALFVEAILSATDNAVLDSIQTAVEVSDNIVHVENAALGATPSGALVMARQDAALSATGSADDDAQPIHVDSNGALWVIHSGDISIDDGGNTITVDGTVTANLSATDNAVLDTIDAVLDTINAKLVSGTVIGDVNLGATDNAVLDSIVTQLTAGAATPVKAEDAASAGGDSGIPAMARRTATPADQSGTDGDYEMLQMDNGRLWVADGAAALGGSNFTMLALGAADNDVQVKASAGTIYSIAIQSLDATPVYLKLFNAASFTPGTTSADLQFMCPANETASRGSGIVLNFPKGIEFDTGIGALIATGIGLTDNTAVSANEVIAVIGWE